jgi:UDP-glucose 4-epimerase
VRDYIHVEDLAEAHLAALERLEAGVPSIACNLGTGTGFSVRAVIEAAREITERPIPARMAARREGDPPELVSGGTRAGELLDWTPRRARLRDIVGDAWRFMQAHPNGY